ncbi:MAG: TolC family protein, partial [Candidatus Dadabacteria bacterium]|nr:TolC family protein [Candidatus Dadabacteria bacterium]
MCKLKFLLLFIIFSVVNASSEPTRRIISIDEAVFIALENNPSVKSTNADIDISKAILKKSKSALYPQIKSKIVVPFIGRESGFFLDQLIWDFGRTHNAIKSNKYNLESSRYSSKNVISELTRDIKIKYYTALIAKNNLQRSNALISQHELQVEKAHELQKVERISHTEYTRAKIELQKSRLTHINNQNIFKTNKLELLNLMGDLDIDDFDISDELSFEKIILTESEYLEVALSSSTQVKSLEALQAGIRAKKSISKSKFYPLIFGRTAYRFEGEGADTPAFIAGIGIEMPLFQGFSRFAEISQAKAELLKNEAQINDLKNDIILTIKKLFLELNHLEKMVEVSKESQLISKKDYELAKERYELELASKIELSESESSYIMAESDYKNSIYNYKITKIK